MTGRRRETGDGRQATGDRRDRQAADRWKTRDGRQTDGRQTGVLQEMETCKRKTGKGRLRGDGRQDSGDERQDSGDKIQDSGDKIQ